MSYRIALATSDRIVVNRHFGHADGFLIVEAEDQEDRVVEYREVSPACDGGTHREASLYDVIRLLADCRYVAASRIGPGARSTLIEFGLTPVEDADLITHVVDRIRQRAQG